MKGWQLTKITTECKTRGKVTITMLYHYYYNYREVITLPCGCDKLCDTYKLGDDHMSIDIPLDILHKFLNEPLSSNSTMGMFRNLENYIDRL